MPKIHTHYDTLSVVRNAPPEVIRAAYKILSQKYHPDRNSDDANANAIMAKINEAYAVLSDPVKRKEYDKWLEKQESSATQQDKPAQKPEPEKKAAKSLDIQDLYAAVIGEKNTDYYLAKFAAFDQQKSGLKPSWNWCAYLFTGFWALYRKMYLWFCVCWFFVAVAREVYSFSSSLWLNFLMVSIILAFPIFADSIYHERVKKKIAIAQQTIKDEAGLLEFLQSGSGVHGWVIWLSAIPVIGIVASIAIPAFIDHKAITPPAVVAAIEPPPVGAEPTATAEPAIVNCKEEITKEQKSRP